MRPCAKLGLAELAFQMPFDPALAFAISLSNVHAGSTMRRIRSDCCAHAAIAAMHSRRRPITETYRPTACRRMCRSPPRIRLKSASFDRGLDAASGLLRTFDLRFWPMSKLRLHHTVTVHRSPSAPKIRRWRLPETNQLRAWY